MKSLQGVKKNRLETAKRDLTGTKMNFRVAFPGTSGIISSHRRTNCLRHSDVGDNVGGSRRKKSEKKTERLGFPSDYGDSIIYEIWRRVQKKCKAKQCKAV